LNLRLFLLCEKLTWFPTIAFFPVSSQTLDISPALLIPKKRRAKFVNFI